MAYTSKFKGADIEALLDKVQSGDSNAIPVVESVDELDVTSPVGTVTVVAKQGGRTILSFRDLAQPNTNMIDANAGTINTIGLSMVNDLQITPPTAPIPVNNLSELNLYFVSSNYGMEDTRKMLQMSVYADNENISLSATINGDSFIELFGISSNPDISDTNYVNNDSITEVLDFVKNNELYYASDLDRVVEGVEIENEWFDILDSIIRPIQETETKAEIYLKEKDYLPIGIPQYSSKSSLIASNPKLGQISSVTSSTEVEKSWGDLYVPTVQEVTANSSGKMVGRALFDRVYSLRDVGLSNLIGMNYLEVVQQLQPKSVFLRERNALNNGAFFIFVGVGLSSFNGGDSFAFVQLNNMSAEEFDSSGISPVDAVITGIDYEQLDKCNAFLKENDIVFLETLGTGLSSDENLQTLSDLVSPNILVESNNLYVNTEYGLLPLFKNDIVDSFRDTVRILQKVPIYNEEDSHTFVECLIPGGISSWVQSSKRDVELHCGSFGENPIEVFTFYLYNVNSLTVWRVTEDTVDISSEVHWNTALPESFDANCMYKVTITFIYANGLTDNKYIIGTYTKF